MTQVIQAYPPNIADIREKFPLTGMEIFCYGDIIYNPCGKPLPRSLMVHEQVHQEQQAGDPASWWVRYLRDPEWRLEQELEAHRAEYADFCRSHTDRNFRARYLHDISHRLASPMYGKLITPSAAARLIRRAR